MYSNLKLPPNGSCPQLSGLPSPSSFTPAPLLPSYHHVPSFTTHPPPIGWPSIFTMAPGWKTNSSKRDGNLQQLFEGNLPSSTKTPATKWKKDTSSTPMDMEGSLASLDTASGSPPSLTMPPQICWGTFLLPMLLPQWTLRLPLQLHATAAPRHLAATAATPKHLWQLALILPPTQHSSITNASAPASSLAVAAKSAPYTPATSITHHSPALDHAPTGHLNATHC